MPEVSDPTPSKHDRETTELKFCCIRIKNTSRGVKKREKREETLEAWRNAGSRA